MKTIRESVQEDFRRDLYWTRITFISQDGSQKSKVLTCASQEFLEDLYKISGRSSLTEEHLKRWVDSVVKKWSDFGENIFRQTIHYDAYANTEEGETNGIDFLLNTSY